MSRLSAPAASSAVGETETETHILLTVVVPVYNGGSEIVANVEAIRRSAALGLRDGALEVIVVSDGSLDGTAERLLEGSRGRDVRVIHYDRNLGKGYAVKLGALAAHGEWVALVDSDLDLDPGSIPGYLELARNEQLDLAIGSKRHPDSVVRYPASRRTASWCYQQLNRLLFRLDVRDTQVGLKLFSRRVVDDVVPLLLVKRFAFDLELLAVASALGYRRMRELPVKLDYRFSGSELRSSAVIGALWDTLAIFYRVRVLRTYQRKRRFFVQRRAAALRPERQPLVTLVGDEATASALDYLRIEPRAAGTPRDAVAAANGEIVALVAPGARPAGNWLTATIPYFADSRVAAVVVPTVTPLRATIAECSAAAVLESRLGGGSRRSRYFPGNVRIVDDFPDSTVVVRRHDAVQAIDAGTPFEELVAWLATRGRLTVYTPDTTVAAPPPPLVRPHLEKTYGHARRRGRSARGTRGSSSSRATAVSLAPIVCAAIGCGLIAFGTGSTLAAGVVLVLLYGGVLALSSVLAAARFRSAAIGIVTAPAIVVTQLTYVAGFVRGLVSR